MTNRELRERADALAAELGIEITTSGLNHAALTELVARLEGQRQAQAEGTPGASEQVAQASELEAPRGAARARRPPPIEDEPETLAPPPEPPATQSAEPAEPVRSGRYVVASGKSVVCARGHVRAGRAITPRDLVSDHERDARQAERVFADLVKRGIVVRA